MKRLNDAFRAATCAVGPLTGPNPGSLNTLALVLALALSSCQDGGGGSGSGGGSGASSGAPLFAKTFGEDGIDVLGDAEPLPDGGYIAVGALGGRRTAGAGEGDPLSPAPLEECDLYVTRLDVFGDPVWSRSLAHGSPSSLTAPSTLLRARVAEAAHDGGFFVAGTVRNQPGSDPNEYSLDINLRKLAPDGATLWTTNVDVPPPNGYNYSSQPLGGEDFPLHIAAVNDGSALVTGFTTAILDAGGVPINQGFLWVLKVDETGQVLWSRNLVEDIEGIQKFSSRHVHVVAGTDGSAFAVRSSHSLGFLGITTNERTEVTKFTPGGVEEWTTEVSNFYVRAAEIAYGNAVLRNDGVVLAGDRNGNDQNPSGARGVVIDDSGSVIFDEQLDFFRVDAGIGRILTPADGVPTFQFVGAKTPAPGSLEIHAFDQFDEPIPELLTRIDGMDRARDIELDRDIFDSTLHILAQGPALSPLSGTGRAVRFEKLTSALGDTPFDEEVELGYPWPLGPNAQHPRHDGGLVPGGPASWTWFDAELHSASTSRLVAYTADGTERWTEFFVGNESLRAEVGLDVEVLPDPFVAGNWRVAVLGRADVDVMGTPEKEANVPWLVVMDQDGSVVSETAIAAAEIGSSVGPGVLESAPNGDLYVALWSDGAPRVAHVNQGGFVAWFSRPISNTADRSAPMHLAAFDTGVVVSVGQVIARFDNTGELVYRRDCPSGPALAIVPISDSSGGIAILSTDAFSNGSPGGYLGQTLYLDLVSGAGERLRRTEWLTEHALVENGGASLVAREDGSYVAQLVRRLDANVTASLTQPSDMIALYGMAPDGTALWHSTYGGVRHERASSLSLANDGGLLVAGETASVTATVDGWLLRLDSCGRINPACPAEFAHEDSGFNVNVSGFPPGTNLSDHGATGFATYTPPVPTTALVATPGEIVITRQCSGASKDSSSSGSGGGGYSGLLDLRVIVEGGGEGTVFVNPPGILCGDDCLYDDLAASGDLFELEARPAAGSVLFGFTGVDSVDGLTGYLTFGSTDRTVRVRFE